MYLSPFFKILDVTLLAPMSSVDIVVKLLVEIENNNLYLSLNDGNLWGNIICHTQIFYSASLSQSLEYVIISYESDWVDIKKCPEILEFVIFDNVTILKMNFISFSIVIETVMLGKIIFYLSTTLKKK